MTEKKIVIISPYSSRIGAKGDMNAKNWPYWPYLIALAKPFPISFIQIGVQGEYKLVSDTRFNMKWWDMEKLLDSADCFIAVDNFLQHFAHLIGIKKGIVIYGKSNPVHFGYPEYINIYKDSKYFRADQFARWHEEPYEKEVFVGPDVVMEKLKECLLLQVPT